jgi:hypothetical protein
VSLLVLSRHVADFVGATEFDYPAIWISWPRLAKTVSESNGDSFLKSLARTPASLRQRHPNTMVNTYCFPGLIRVLTDQNPFAHSLRPMDMMRQGWLWSFRQASQQ